MTVYILIDVKGYIQSSQIPTSTELPSSLHIFPIFDSFFSTKILGSQQKHLNFLP